VARTRALDASHVATWQIPPDLAMVAPARKNAGRQLTSDGSTTAPHLRRARTFDEGGRGLMLVAQLTQGWGTRQTPDGKIIWAEQALPTEPSAT